MGQNTCLTYSLHQILTLSYVFFLAQRQASILLWLLQALTMLYMEKQGALLF